MKNNLYSISAHLPFADTLAGWMLKRWGEDPLVLSRARVLVPSRRAALTLREAFLRASGGRPLLLPKMEPLGDAAEDAMILEPLGSLTLADLPPANFEMRRLFILSRLIGEYRGKITGRPERADHAFRLAQALGDLLDELEREERSLEGVKDIVPDSFAEHWQATVEFLQILSQHWPRIAEEEKLPSPHFYRGRALRALGEHWLASLPSHPVIVAGTTGSVPATADLVAAIARLAEGYVVLPGLDMKAGENYFSHLDETHPQWGMARLLKKLDYTPDEVRAIGEASHPRAGLLREVMRPAALSDAWRALVPDEKAKQGLRYIPCDNIQEEATVIALLLRETLEEPSKTAALVTPNRALARRVAAIMRRFGVTVDDSAGTPLKETPLASFLRLIMTAALDDFSPLSLLSLLKHPLAQAGLERLQCLEAARALEMEVRQKLFPGGGLDFYRHMLMSRDRVTPVLFRLLDNIEKAFAPLLEALRRQTPTLGALLHAQAECAEALSGGMLWDGPEAETMSDMLAELHADGAAREMIVEAEAYPGLFDSLLEGRAVRPEYGMHPRVKILGLLEARLQSFDRMILGGLNEGGWPQKPVSDAWFSRPMRAELGLPSPERRIGLSAHDFYMLAASPEVIFTRAAKEGNMPTQPSRWLTKLLMLTDGLPDESAVKGWAAGLDAAGAVTPGKAPAPTPPLAARPREVPVTDIELWMRDPYAFYAKRILKLRPLGELGRAPNGADFGIAVHRALERFTLRYPGPLPDNALALLLEEGSHSFRDIFAASPIELIWWPRFRDIAEWVIAAEEERRIFIHRIAGEIAGACRVGDVMLTGRADRIEEWKDGSFAIIDYKTGKIPNPTEIESGLKSQLVLLALIAREGGMLPAMKESAVLTLEYWRLKGGEEPAEIRPLKPEKIEEYIAAARDGIMKLIARFDDPDYPYRSVPVPARASANSDYDHLARIKEWG